MATFRTGADGRTVISDDNRVTVQAGDIDRGGFTARERAAGINRIGADPGTARTVNRFDDDFRSGGFGPPVAGLDTGTGYMTRQEFENVAGMTDTNPYGRDGFFSRVFGIDPDKIDYTSTLGPRGIENVKRQEYDRFLNPFAKVDAFGRPTMFADASAGTTRRGVRPGDLTIYGPAVESRPEPLTGIASIFNDTMIGRLANPPRTRITGYDTNVLLPDLMEGPAVGGGTEPPGVPYFTSSTAPTRDAASVPESTFRPLFTTDPEERNLIEEDFEVNRRATAEDSPVSRGTVPESTYRRIFTDDMPTVAEIIAAEPMVTERPSAAVPGYVDPVIDPDTGLVVEGGTRLPTGPKVIQAIPGGDPGSASITVNPQSQSPEYVAPNQPVDLLSDILAPDGTILPGVMEGISSGQPRREVDPRTGRIPGTSGTFDFAGGTAANVTTFSPQDVARMNKRAQDIDALRFQYIQQGMNPTLAFARARMQVGG